jgi:large subunit ribosomal protein L4e
MARNITIYDVQGRPSGSLTSTLFDYPLRLDIIKKAVVALQSHRFQPQGRDPMAGKRTSAESFGVGRDLARIPRVKGERHREAGSGAFAPMTVGGRLAHPPSPQKRISKKVNRKEKLVALKSALAAAGMKDLVQERGHVITQIPEVPLVVTDEFETISKVSEVRKVLISLGVWDDVVRVLSRRKILPRNMRRRGRVYRFPVGPLIVVGRDRGLGTAVRNIPGIDLVEAKDLNVELLAPGTRPGRLTIWSESAIKALNEKLAKAW